MADVFHTHLSYYLSYMESVQGFIDEFVMRMLYCVSFKWNGAFVLFPHFILYP